MYIPAMESRTEKLALIRTQAKAYFVSLQAELLAGFQKLDPVAKLEKKSWDRPGGGGGTMGVVRGTTVEKAGANFSEVHGEKYPAIESKHKDEPFYATGVSTISHMQNPHAPKGHMNLRYLEVGDTCWFGGGADLTPCMKYEEDTRAFHAALEGACKTYSSDAYQKYSKWCEEYFYIKHRKEERGVGGIFFDYLEEDPLKTFEFVKSVGAAYAKVFFDIQHKRTPMEYSEEQKIEQEYWRGRYVEFNLLYDRGTRFGLMTGGNLDAIFVSLPPKVRW
jgi:coproporphyrinogen III oxidase